MIHPDTFLQYINDDIGYGVFAKKHIPKGTIVYVKDALEITVPHDSHLMSDDYYGKILEKYSYVDSNGEYILSWDFGRFVNHSCEPNTLSTGYGFEIAIRNILAGEQITDDYGLFNMREAMDCYCGTTTCRKIVSHADFTNRQIEWDAFAQSAIMEINAVEQPLMHLLDRDIYNSLLTFLNSNMEYLSVCALKTEVNEINGRRKKRNSSQAS